MLPPYLAHLALAESERELRDRLLVQCEVWLSRHARVLYAALAQAREEHAGCDDLRVPEIHIMMRADLHRYEPSVTVTGSIRLSTEDIEP